MPLKAYSEALENYHLLHTCERVVRNLPKKKQTKEQGQGDQKKEEGEAEGGKKEEEEGERGRREEGGGQ